jgi:membrane protein implicated in regulation of membrane protease activity
MGEPIRSGCFLWAFVMLVLGGVAAFYFLQVGSWLFALGFTLISVILTLGIASLQRRRGDGGDD